MAQAASFALYSIWQSPHPLSLILWHRLWTVEEINMKFLSLVFDFNLTSNGIISITQSKGRNQHNDGPSCNDIPPSPLPCNWCSLGQGMAQGHQEREGKDSHLSCPVDEIECHPTRVLEPLHSNPLLYCLGDLVLTFDCIPWWMTLSSPFPLLLLFWVPAESQWLLHLHSHINYLPLTTPSVATLAAFPPPQSRLVIIICMTIQLDPVDSRWPLPVIMCTDQSSASDPL